MQKQLIPITAVCLEAGDVIWFEDYHGYLTVTDTTTGNIIASENHLEVWLDPDTTVWILINLDEAPDANS